MNIKEAMSIIAEAENYINKHLIETGLCPKSNAACQFYVDCEWYDEGVDCYIKESSQCGDDIIYTISFEAEELKSEETIKSHIEKEIELVKQRKERVEALKKAQQEEKERAELARLLNKYNKKDQS